MNLYKYISSVIWTKVLKERRLRFSPPSVFNDPFEMQPFYEPLSDDPAVQEHLNVSEMKGVLEELFLEQYPSLPEEIKELVPTDFLKSYAGLISPFELQHSPALLTQLTSVISRGLYDGFNEHLGVLSLSEKRDDLLMWAHYSEHHKGLVIGFDSNHEYFNQKLSPSDEFRHLRKVRYSITRPVIRLSTADDATDILLTKSADWRYEEEWRMLRPLRNASETIPSADGTLHLYSFPADCVTEIILGYRMPADAKTQIIEYVRTERNYSNVKLYVAELDKKEFRLNFVKAEI
jgi:hypothetical protein